MKKILIFVLAAIIVWLMLLDFFPRTTQTIALVILWSVFYTTISTFYLFVPKREVRDARNTSIAWGILLLFLLGVLCKKEILVEQNLFVLTTLLFIWFFIANKVVGGEMLQDNNKRRLI